MLLFHFLWPFFEVACVAYENRKLFLITAADNDEEVCSDVKMANHISRERTEILVVALLPVSRCTIIIKHISFDPAFRFPAIAEVFTATMQITLGN